MWVPCFGEGCVGLGWDGCDAIVGRRESQTKSIVVGVDRVIGEMALVARCGFVGGDGDRRVVVRWFDGQLVEHVEDHCGGGAAFSERIGFGRWWWCW